MIESHFKHLILLEPLGLMYGSSGRLLSPEALTGLAAEHFPPDSPALAGLLGSQLERDSIRHLYTAGPFWCNDMGVLMLPTPLTLLQEAINGRRVSKRRLEWKEGDGALRPTGWWPVDNEEPPRKAPIGGWVSLDDWNWISQDQKEITVCSNPWKAVPHLHPRLKEDERVSAKEGALFLEYGIALQSDVQLAYLSSHKVNEGVYRFGGEGHLVQLSIKPIPDHLQHLMTLHLDGPFALITPGVWGGPKLSRREPMDTRLPAGQFPWHRHGEAPGILTDKPRPWRYRRGKEKEAKIGQKPIPRMLSRGRWAVPAGSCYRVAGDSLPPWVAWNEDWFPREGFSFKQLGTALALPLSRPTG